MKKVISIMLVLAMACALFIVPAHAHEAEETEIMPRAMLCDDPGGCNKAMAHRTKDNGKVYTQVPSCADFGYSHNHYQMRYLKYYVCVTAGCRYYNLPVPDTNYLGGQFYCALTDLPVN